MFPATYLASAVDTPSAWANVTFGLTLLAVAAVSAILATVPIVIARRRRSRLRPTIALVSLCWGILIAADVGYGINRNETDEARNQKMILAEAGDVIEPPVWPWLSLAPALVFYAALVAVAATSRDQ